MEKTPTKILLIKIETDQDAVPVCLGAPSKRPGRRMGCSPVDRGQISGANIKILKIPNSTKKGLYLSSKGITI